MPEQIVQLDPAGYVPERNKKIVVILQSADGNLLGQMGFDCPREPISMLVTQMQIVSDGKPRACVANSSKEAEFFTVENWEPNKRILTAKLKK